MPFWLEIILGFIVLIVGADAMVRGSSKIARGFGVPPIVIGMTLVAYGTSAPEFAVSATATLNGVGSMALGNALGSNIANIGLVLGLTALLRPIIVEKTALKREAPLLIGISLLFPLFFLDGSFSLWEGLIAFAGGAAFTISSLKSSKKREVVVEREPLDAKGWLFNLFLVGIGITGLIFGGDWLVSGASELAGMLGMSNRVIGLTVVAIGTSLPELATSLVAMFKGESDIAIGNIIGSNIFNLLFVLGGAATLAPFTFDTGFPGVWIDAIVGLALAVGLFFFARSGLNIGRWEGTILLLAYLGFIVYTVV